MSAPFEPSARPHVVDEERRSSRHVDPFDMPELPGYEERPAPRDRDELVEAFLRGERVP